MLKMLREKDEYQKLSQVDRKIIKKMKIDKLNDSRDVKKVSGIIMIHYHDSIHVLLTLLFSEFFLEEVKFAKMRHQ